jgi:LuxR family maltose regulon positive regulatory protein
LHLGHKLTLISAPAGFGKTTLVSEWLAGGERPAAWLSLDEGDNDLKRFLAYLVAALQTLALSEVEGIAARQPPVGHIGEGVSAVLQSPQPPRTESILTTLLNEIAIIADSFILVLDDYHGIDTKSVDKALAFLLEHLPPQMHVVIATREDPNLPLARLRGRGQLTELRVSDLRFTTAEAAEFLNQVMDLNLSAEDIGVLETRTEGWITGLHLAALALQGTVSMQGHKHATSFIKSFAGSHHFVLDYLVEEVLQQQPESIQTFLLRTSVLDRMCGPLCDAVTLQPAASGQETLEYLHRANLFIVPLDNERCWYRYHHLFADLLRQRLHQSTASSTRGERGGVDELHSRASVWYEENGLEIEAFHHAAAANDIERAARLVEGDGMPLTLRGAAAPVLNWLASLPTTVLDDKPSLWVTYASALVFAGQSPSAEQKLQAAEAALQGAEPDNDTNDIVGHIAAVRAMVALRQRQVETIIAQSRRALEYLHPDNLAVRTATNWTLGMAYRFQGDRAAASQAYAETISICQATGNVFINIVASTSLGIIQESENQLNQAAQNYKRVLQLTGDPPKPTACEACLGLARVYYEWNDLNVAEQYARQSLRLARQLGSVETPAASKVLLARLKLARGNVAGAAAVLVEAEQFTRQRNIVDGMPDVATVQVLTLLRQENLAAAAQLAERYELPLSQARVHLAQGETAAALAVLEPYNRQVEARGWQDELLKVRLLQALSHQAQGEMRKALQLLDDALALAEPGGFIRIFVDEGIPMAQLLSETAAHGIMPDYTGKLLAAFESEKKSEDKSYLPPDPSAQPLIEPLSHRELEVLRLIAHGLSNREISERLFLAMSTVKGHNRNIFAKLQVQRRTEAVARARELDLL